MYRNVEFMSSFIASLLFLSEDDPDLPPNRTTSVQSQFSDAGSLTSADIDAEGMHTPHVSFSSLY